MAYLGPPPSQTPANPTSQYFSGNGSTTTFTLNRPVNVAEDLNVYVNNVAQQPGAGKSYTASGTNLIFDAAPDAGTNNVYVVYVQAISSCHTHRLSPSRGLAQPDRIDGQQPHAATHTPCSSSPPSPLLLLRASPREPRVAGPSSSKYRPLISRFTTS